MLEEIIKELTATSNDDHITSVGVLAWAKRVKVQRVQAAVLNMLTESREFDKVKISKRTKRRHHYSSKWPDNTVAAMQVLWGNTPAETMPSMWQDVCGVQQDGTFQEGLPQ